MTVLALAQGKLKRLQFKVMPSSGGKLALLQIHFPFLLLCMAVIILPQHCGRPVIRNRLIFRFILEEYYPVLPHWDFSVLIPELLESVPRAAVGHPHAWIPPSPATHPPAMSPNTLPPPPVPPGQLSPWMWTLLLRWWQKQPAESQPISPLWLLSWNTVAESGGRWAINAPLVLHPALPDLVRAWSSHGLNYK